MCVYYMTGAPEGSPKVGEYSFDKRYFQFPLECNMAFALVGRSSRTFWRKGSLYELSRVNFHQYIYKLYLVTFIYHYVKFWRFCGSLYQHSFFSAQVLEILPLSCNLGSSSAIVFPCVCYVASSANKSI